MINLGRQLIFDYCYTHQAFPNASHQLVESSNSFFCDDFNYIEAEKLEECAPKGNIFINVASMQEMTMSTIEKYFNLFRSQEEALFYCCNRTEKILPDNSTIKFNNYGWTNDDEFLIDECCPWYQKSPINMPPFYRYYEGQVWHRLARLKTTNSKSTINPKI